jgi:hypothetical protein
VISADSSLVVAFHLFFARFSSENVISRPVASSRRDSASITPSIYTPTYMYLLDTRE